MKVFHSPAHAGHAPRIEFESSRAHVPFEGPSRADTILATLSADDRFEPLEARTFGTTPIHAVHDPGLERFLATAWLEYQEVHPETAEVVPDVFYRPSLRADLAGVEPRSIDGRLGWWCFEVTTPLTRGTYVAARGAVDTALSTAEAVLDGDRTAYGLCRPPGHHAGTGLYGGYCFFNNAAIAAHHVASVTGSKVTVLDVDYHHGNGTQEIFYRRGDVQYVSLHADPTRAYPYWTGYEDETGSGPGAGTNHNIALEAGITDDTYLTSLDRALAAVAAFGPAIVVVSLGLDTFAGDPICDFSLSTEGLGRCGTAVAGLDLPVIVIQEGGYDVEHLGDNARTWLLGLCGPTPRFRSP